MSYQHHAFLSYRRSANVSGWVHNHFLPLLQSRINENAQRDIEIWCDSEIEAGASWPDHIRNHLKTSGLLIVVASADYFRSPWCMSEWQSFREREKILGLAGPQNSAGLIYPVRYSDGDYYHADFKRAQCLSDFCSYNYSSDVFRQSTKYLEFDDKIQEMAKKLLVQIDHIPEWREDFPTIDEEPMQPPRLVRPVLT